MGGADLSSRSCHGRGTLSLYGSRQLRTPILAAVILYATAATALAQSTPTFTVDVWNGDGPPLPAHGWSSPDHPPESYTFDIAEPTPLAFGIAYLATIELGFNDGGEQFNGSVVVYEEDGPPIRDDRKYLPMTHGEAQPSLRPNPPIRLTVWLNEGMSEDLRVAGVKTISITASERCVSPYSLYYGVVALPPCWPVQDSRN